VVSEEAPARREPEEDDSHRASGDECCEQRDDSAPLLAQGSGSSGGGHDGLLGAAAPKLKWNAPPWPALDARVRRLLPLLRYRDAARLRPFCFRDLE